MSAVINTNIAAIRTHNVYNRNDTQMNAALSRVATGMKINSAKDGASTWAISEKMRERMRANDQANQNVQNDTALLKTAQGGISNTIDILKTLKERAINAANDSNLNEDRGRIAVEVEQLLNQINDNADKVQFNGRKLLDGAGKDETKSGFTASTETNSSSGVTAPTAATMPDNVTGNSAVYSLTGLKDSDDNAATSTTLLTDMSFEEGDTITFSWIEDGASTAQTKEITVEAGTAVSDLAFTESKLSVSWLDTTDTLEDQNNVATTGTAAGNPTAAGLFAVGDKSVEITDFKVAVTDSEGATSAMQDKMKFTGVQQSEGVVASNSVYELSDPTALYDANTGTATQLTATTFGDGLLRGLTTSSSASSGDIIKVNDEVTISYNDGTQDRTATVTVAAGTAISDLFDAAGLTLVTGDGTSTLQDDSGNDVTDKNGDNVTGTNGTIYAVGAAGTKISNLTFSVTAGSSTGTDTDAAAAALNGLVSSTVQVAGDKVEETNNDNNNNTQTGGSKASLTFHIGGDKNFSMTAEIAGMTVSNLFGKEVSEIATMFTDKDTAKEAIGLIDTALGMALDTQTKLGAYESRLGYTADNLTTMNENLEAADSVMRDSDIAKEMTNYMKYSVLAQASQYMLAQSGQNAFSVLNLLQA